MHTVFDACLLMRTNKILASRTAVLICSLHDPVTWYKITHAGEQVAQWNFQNNATCTSPPGPAFVLEVPLRNLLTSAACVMLHHVTGSCKGPIAIKVVCRLVIDLCPVLLWKNLFLQMSDIFSFELLRKTSLGDSIHPLSNSTCTLIGQLHNSLPDQVTCKPLYFNY